MAHHRPTPLGSKTIAWCVIALIFSSKVSLGFSDVQLQTKSVVKVVVSGAGPASLLFSYAFLQNTPPNVQIQMFDKVMDVKHENSTNKEDAKDLLSYAFGFGLGGRAFHHLENACSKDVAEKVKAIGAPTPTGSLYITNRRDMVAIMKKCLLKEFPNRVTITHGAKVTSVNQDGTAANVVFLDNETKGVIPYDLLVAGDGIRSSIRDNLVERKLIKCKSYLRPVLWKALQLPPQPNVAETSFLPFHIHQKGEPQEYGALLPKFGGKFVLLSFWNLSRNKKEQQTNSFQSTSVEEFQTKLQTIFPNITCLPDETVLQQYLDQTPGTETYRKLNQHAVPSLRVAFIGDASVGMYSHMGQGVASAFERASLLASTLTSSDSFLNRVQDKNQMKTALENFSDISVKQGNAIVDLNLLAHLTYNPRFKKYMVDMRTLSPKLNSPELQYSDIQKDYKWKVRLTKLLWRFERLSMNSMKYN